MIGKPFAPFVPQDFPDLPHFDWNPSLPDEPAPPLPDEPAERVRKRSRDPELDLSEARGTDKKSRIGGVEADGDTNTDTEPVHVITEAAQAEGAQRASEQCLSDLLRELANPVHEHGGLAAERLDRCMARLEASVASDRTMAPSARNRGLARAWVAQLVRHAGNVECTGILRIIGQGLANARWLGGPVRGFRDEVAMALDASSLRRCSDAGRNTALTTAATALLAHQGAAARQAVFECLMDQGASGDGGPDAVHVLGKRLRSLAGCLDVPGPDIGNWVRRWPTRTLADVRQSLVLSVSLCLSRPLLDPKAAGLVPADHVLQLAARPGVASGELVDLVITVRTLWHLVLGDAAHGWTSTKDQLNDYLDDLLVALRLVLDRSLAAQGASRDAPGDVRRVTLGADPARDEAEGFELAVLARAGASKLPDATFGALLNAWFDAFEAAESASERERWLALGRGAIAGCAAMGEVRLMARIAKAALGSEPRVFAFTALVAGRDVPEGIALQWMTYLLDHALKPPGGPDDATCWRAAVDAMASSAWTPGRLHMHLRHALLALPAPATEAVLNQRLDMAIALESRFWKPDVQPFPFDVYHPAATALGAEACEAGRAFSMPTRAWDRWVHVAGRIHMLQSKVFGGLPLKALSPKRAPSPSAELHLDRLAASLLHSVHDVRPRDAPVTLAMALDELPLAADATDCIRLGMAIEFQRPSPFQERNLHFDLRREWCDVLGSRRDRSAQLLHVACGYVLARGNALPEPGVEYATQQLLAFTDVHMLSEWPEHVTAVVAAVSQALVAHAHDAKPVAAWLCGLLYQVGMSSDELAPTSASVTTLVRAATLPLTPALRAAVAQDVLAQVEALGRSHSTFGTRDARFTMQLAMTHGLSHAFDEALDDAWWDVLGADLARVARDCAPRLPLIKHVSRADSDYDLVSAQESVQTMLRSVQHMLVKVQADMDLPEPRRKRLDHRFNALGLRGLQQASAGLADRIAVDQIRDFVGLWSGGVATDPLSAQDGGFLLALRLGGPDMSAAARLEFFQAARSRLDFMSTTSLTRFTHGVYLGCGAALRGAATREFMDDLAHAVVHRAPVVGDDDLLSRVRSGRAVLTGGLTAHAVTHWLDAVLRPQRERTPGAQAHVLQDDWRATLTGQRFGRLFIGMVDDLVRYDGGRPQQHPALVAAALAFEHLPADSGQVLTAMWAALAARNEPFATGARRLLALAAQQPRTAADAMISAAVHVALGHEDAEDGRVRFNSAEPAAGPPATALHELERQLAALAAADGAAGRRLALLYLRQRESALSPAPFAGDEDRRQAIERLLPAGVVAGGAMATAMDELDRQLAVLREPLKGLGGLRRGESGAAVFDAFDTAMAVPGMLDAETTPQLWERVLAMRLPKAVAIELVERFLVAAGPLASLEMYGQARRYLMPPEHLGLMDHRLADRKQFSAAQGLFAAQAAPLSAASALCGLYAKPLFDAAGLGFLLHAEGVELSALRVVSADIARLARFAHEELDEIGRMLQPQRSQLRRMLMAHGLERRAADEADEPDHIRTLRARMVPNEQLETAITSVLRVTSQALAAIGTRPADPVMA